MRHLAKAPPDGTRITAIDLDEAMPAHAAKVNGAPPGASHGQANVLAPPFKEIVFQARMPGA